jgi:hypothetical protein
LNNISTSNNDYDGNDDDDDGNSNCNNFVQFFIIHVLAQQPSGQL